jgi:hypothetical protein
MILKGRIAEVVKADLEALKKELVASQTKTQANWGTTVFFKGGMSTTAPHFESAKPVAFKCNGCAAPLPRGKTKCWYCGSEYVWANITPSKPRRSQSYLQGT